MMGDTLKRLRHMDYKIEANLCYIDECISGLKRESMS